MDKNSKTVCDTSQNPSEALLFWLNDHMDPQINPWATDRWKQTEEIFREDVHNVQNMYPNCIDPTANRLYKVYVRTLYIFLKKERITRIASCYSGLGMTKADYKEM